MANTDLVNEGLLGAYHDELMKTHLAGGVVFDISAYNLTNGQPTPYADLAAALGTNGANVPEPLRKGGMSVKYVRTSDNKYVQARCMAQNFTTDITQWQGVDDEPTAGSKNLVESGGIYKTTETANATKDALGGLNIDLSVFETKNGVCDSQRDRWYIATGYTHKVFRVVPNTRLEVTAGNSIAYINFLKEYPEDIDYTTAPVTSTILPSVIITSNETKIINIPSDAKSCVVAVTSGGNNVIPSSMTYMGLHEVTDTYKSVYENVAGVVYLDKDIDVTAGTNYNGDHTVIIPQSACYISVTGDESIITNGQPISVNILLDNNTWDNNTIYFNAPAIIHNIPSSAKSVTVIINGSRIKINGTINVNITLVTLSERLTKLEGIVSPIPTIVGTHSEEIGTLNENVLGSTIATKSINIVQGQDTHEMFTGLTLKKGHEYRLSITGDSSLITTNFYQFFVDYTNHINLQPFAFNSYIDYVFTDNCSNVQVNIARRIINASGTVTAKIEDRGNTLKIETLTSKVESSDKRIKVLEGESVNLQYSVPSYYFTNDYLDNKVERINTIARSVANIGDAFVFITDIHWNNLNAHQSPSLLRYLYQNSNIENMFSGGDVSQSTPVGGEREICEILRKTWNGKIYHAVGNHEEDNGNTYGEVYYNFNMYNDNLNGSQKYLYNYIDNVSKKTRYVILNSERYTLDEQYQWFVNDALNTEAGWKVFVFTHWLCGWQPGWPAGDASYSITEDIENTSGRYAVAIKTANSDVSKGNVVAVLQGHWHFDRIRYISNGVPVIMSAADKYEGAEVPAGTRVPGTITEQSFDAVISDYEGEMLYMVRIGGLVYDGIDNTNPVEERHISYKYNTVSVGSTITITSGLSGTLTWTSSDSAKATVNSDGVVTGVAEGMIWITARDTTNKITYTCMVSVTN